MDEPVRLVCPDCQLVYRLKRLTPGKQYRCRQCGVDLRSLEPVRLTCASCGAVSEEKDFDPANPPRCQLCEDAPPLLPPDDNETTIAKTNLDASASAQSAINTGGSSPRRAGSARGGDLERLPRLIEDLLGRLENFRLEAAEEDAAQAENNRKLMEATVGLAESLRTLNDQLVGDVGGLGDKVGLLLAKLEEGELPALSERVRETGSLFLERLDEFKETQQQEFIRLLEERAESANRQLDTDDLAEKLAIGLKARVPFVDAESVPAIDALVRVADGLIKEQNANTLRLDRLGDDIRQAVARIADLDEWQGGLPERVADEIGRTVEARVVDPLSGALARQAPTILADLQDNKLVDIVSRSVREAQRPLLREILTGRGGVSTGVFLAVVLPLLMVLGALLLPGALGYGNDAARLNAIAASLERIEYDGVPVGSETTERLSAIEEVVADIHGEAMAHVKNAATMEEEIRSLKLELEKREQSLKEFNETVQRQTRRLRAYENRLTRLGISPDSIEE